MAIAMLIIFIIIFIGLLYLMKYLVSKLHLYYAIKDLPGPAAFPIVGNALLFTGNVSEVCSRIIGLANIYPSLSRLWMAFRLFIFVYDPENTKAVLTSPNAIHKSEDYNVMKPFLGDGLLSAPATLWRVHRKSLSTAFHLNALKTFVDAFVKHSNIFIRKLELTQGKEIDVFHYVSRCALDIIYETTMETEMNLQENQDCKIPTYLDSILEIFTMRMFKIWLHPNIIFYNSAVGKKQQEFSNYVNGFTNEIIRKKKMALEANNVKKSTQKDKENEKNNPKMFIDLLMELRKNDDKLSETYLRDEINTMTVAGSDTSSCGMTFLFLMLATFPEIQNKVYQELYEIYGSSDPEEVPVCYNDLQRMDYLERAIKESLRLFPVAPLVLRRVMEDIKTEDNRIIPKGSTVIIAIIILHRNKKYWSEPLKFDPDRFLPENIATRHPYNYIPFSGGPRNCIGSKFAMLEIKAIVATTLRKFIVTIDKPVPIEEIDVEINITLKATKPIMLRFKKRQ